MMVVGDPDLWSDTFPEELVPRVLDLITDTWATFEKPGPADLEVPTTRRFKHALKQAKDFSRLPVRLEREPAEDDPETGEELGRIDLKFLPAVSAREEVYFAFECKRLNALVNGTRRSLAPDYVTEGMMRFVTGQYAGFMQHGGMLSYVLDGRCDDAIRLVEQNVARRATELCMDALAALAPSRLRPAMNHVRETGHNLHSLRPFILHHVFLDCGNESRDGDALAVPCSPKEGLE
jgi:hypothetical protein